MNVSTCRLLSILAISTLTYCGQRAVNDCVCPAGEACDASGSCRALCNRATDCSDCSACSGGFCESLPAAACQEPEATFTPADGSLVGAITPIVVHFSQPMSEHSVGIGGTLAEVALQTDWLEATQLTLTPEVSWPEGSHTVELSGRSHSNVVMAGVSVSYLVDPVFPTLIEQLPPDGTLINGTHSVELTFSKPIEPTSLQLSGPLGAAAQIAWVDEYVLQLQPAALWPEGQGVALEVQLSDLAGNLATFSLSYSVDSTPPVPVSTPGDGEPLGHYQDILLNFGEPVVVSSVVLGGALAEEYDEEQWSSANDILTLKKNSHWEPGTDRTLSVEATDLVGNIGAVTFTFLEPHRVVFITSSTGTGNLSTWANAGGAAGIAAGDAICNARAQAAGLLGTFVAWLSDETSDAYCRVHQLTGHRSANCGQGSLPDHAGPWVNTHDEPFINSVAEASSALYRTFYYPVRYDETGSPTNTFYFTGTFGTGGHNSGYTCSNWAAATGSARIGHSTALGDNFTAGGSGPCGTARPLLCFEVGPGQGTELVLPAPTGKIVFQTSVRRSGKLGDWPEALGAAGIAAGDAICNHLASAAGLAGAGSFKAWLSDSAVHAKDRLTSNGPWSRLDGVRIAENKDALLSENGIGSAILVDEKGKYGQNFGVWTGTTAAGAVAEQHCDNWGSAETSDQGVAGSQAHANAQWVVHGIPRTCDGNRHLYCFEDE